MPFSRNTLFIFPVFFLIFGLFLFTDIAHSAVPADANGDGKADGLDYSVWLSNYNKTTSEGASGGDFNLDQKIDGLDYVIWLNSYGSNPMSPTPSLKIQQNTPTLAPASSSEGILISKTEIMNLPTSGTPWNNLKTAASGSWGISNLADQDNKFGIKVLAGALVYAREGDSALRTKVRDGIIAAKRTLDEPSEWQTTNGALSLGRQLGAFVFSADLIGLKNFDPAADTEFRDWLRKIRTANVGTHGRWKNITYTCENSANNWGTFACPSRIAASIYLEDSTDVQRAANIIRAFMGERQYYPSDAPGQNGYFQHTDLGATSSWPCNESAWTAVNPDCIKSGINISGALVEDASRGGNCCALAGDGNMYSWEVLQGVFVSTELLYRTGKFGNPYLWSDKALKRSLDFLQRSGWNITTPSPYIPWLANFRYGTNYPATTSTSGRIMSWGDWLYQ